MSVDSDVENYDAEILISANDEDFVAGSDIFPTSTNDHRLRDGEEFGYG
jgi:hypothetical protein